MSIPLEDIPQAIADAITDAVTATELAGEALQVYGLRLMEPTPPCVDVYPASEFSDQIAYSPNVNREVRFVVRARVATTDSDASQRLLLQLMDDLAETSVAAAVRGDRTLGGKVQNVAVEGPSYGDYNSTLGVLAGCEWLARVTR